MLFVTIHSFIQKIAIKTINTVLNTFTYISFFTKVWLKLTCTFHMLTSGKVFLEGSTGCPGYFSPFLKGYNLANNRLRAKILAYECDLWTAILFETKKKF